MPEQPENTEKITLRYKHLKVEFEWNEFDFTNEIMISVSGDRDAADLAVLEHYLQCAYDAIEPPGSSKKPGLEVSGKKFVMNTSWLQHKHFSAVVKAIQDEIEHAHETTTYEIKQPPVTLSLGIYADAQSKTHHYLPGITVSPDTAGVGARVIDYFKDSVRAEIKGKTLNPVIAANRGSGMRSVYFSMPVYTPETWEESARAIDRIAREMAEKGIDGMPKIVFVSPGQKPGQKVDKLLKPRGRKTGARLPEDNEADAPLPTSDEIADALEELRELDSAWIAALRPYYKIEDNGPDPKALTDAGWIMNLAVRLDKEIRSREVTSSPSMFFTAMGAIFPIPTSDDNKVVLNSRIEGIAHDLTVSIDKGRNTGNPGNDGHRLGN